MHASIINKSTLVRALAFASLFCAIACDMSCGYQEQSTPYSNFPLSAPGLFDGLPDVARLASTPGDFLPRQNGADFASDLADNRCAINGTFATISPNYGAPTRTLSDAAYCLYRLELDPAQSPATLKLVWNGAPPSGSECWIGLSSWAKGIWEWQPLSSNSVDIEDPVLHADESKRCYLALVVLGTTPVELVSVGFGAIPPPDTNGYTLFQPLQGKTSYLIDDDGNVVHSWPGEYMSGAAVELDENGRLWRQVMIFNSDFQFGGRGGRLEVLDWDANLIWEYELSTERQCTHHDIERMPNGNILLTVWNRYTKAEIIAAGRDTAKIGVSGLYIDSIIEIDTLTPEPSIVWQWQAYDHLIQDFDSNQANYGDPAAHPELIDLNYTMGQGMDWTHTNAVAYNAELDQIVLSVHGFNELWIIDHSTTTAEAASHSGGIYGRGGDLLYRWGNQAAYRAGTAEDRKLFGQHDVHWIGAGLQGAGDLLLFNNMAGNPEGAQYSSVMELVTPLNPDGSYYMTDSAYGPAAPVWQYTSDPPEAFFSPSISGAQRLPDGNTLVCDGANGKFFEITSDGETVWEYLNQDPSPGAQVFRAIRYQVDYSGLAGLFP